MLTAQSHVRKWRSQSLLAREELWTRAGRRRDESTERALRKMPRRIHLRRRLLCCWLPPPMLSTHFVIDYRTNVDAQICAEKSLIIIDCAFSWMYGIFSIFYFRFVFPLTSFFFHFFFSPHFPPLVLSPTSFWVRRPWTVLTVPALPSRTAMVVAYILHCTKQIARSTLCTQ